MQPVGDKPIVWKEAGEWWKNDPDRQITRYIDSKGIRRELIEPISPKLSTSQSKVRIRSIRDEKVSLANGHIDTCNFGTPAQKKFGTLFYLQSAFTLGGTILASEAPALAAEKGYKSACLADYFSFTGVHEFCATAKKVGIKPIIGVTVELKEGGTLTLIAQNSLGYISISQLITECHVNEPRGYPLATWERVSKFNKGVICLTSGSKGIINTLISKRKYSLAKSSMELLIQIYGSSNVFVQIERTYLPWQYNVNYYLLQLAKKYTIKCIPGGPILMNEPETFPAHDVLTCVDTLCLIEEIEGRKPFRDPSQPNISFLPRRPFNREQHIKPAQEFQNMYSDLPELITNANLLAELCDDCVLPLRSELPQFCKNEEYALTKIVEHGAALRFGNLNNAVKKRLEVELNRLIKLGWSRHFLIAWEMCQWAENNQILFSGRGSVVDSLVAYCLGISRIDAFRFNLHFDRFLPPDGSKRPDIDIDFEAKRREDVRQHLIEKYGDNNVATVAAIGTYRSRGIVREVGKVMGIPEQQISFLSKRIHGGVSPEKLYSALTNRPELSKSNIPKEKVHWIFEFAQQLSNLPRNIRAHSSGIIISNTPISHTVPVQLSGADGVKIIQWDKRSAKHYFDKFDVLCLRGNDVLGGTMRRVEELNVCDIPLDDNEVFRAMQSGQLIGIPQSASPAMRQAHIRIQTKSLKDAGIVQAGIRPGVGGAVKLNEFVARRKGKPFQYIHPDLEEILGPTLGIVVFQEQIDRLLAQFGGYSGDDAEMIREAIQKHHDQYKVGDACHVIIEQITKNGYSLTVAQEVYQLIAGFKGYGFAEGHALSFAEISIRSIFCQQNYPAEYFAALLDAQPAGYYGPATIANEARIRGVKILPPCINKSNNQFKVESVKSSDDPQIVFPNSAIRVPFKQISGLSAELCNRIVENQPYASLFDFVNKTHPHQNELENLILSGAFDSISNHRRAVMWLAKQAIKQSRSPLNSSCLPLEFSDPPLPLHLKKLSGIDQSIAERRLLGLDIEQHLMAYERKRIQEKGGLTCSQASTLNSNQTHFVVGNPIRLRFPPTQSGKRVMFFDLEDETGLLNVTCFDNVYQRDGHQVICQPFVTVKGITQNRDGHIAFLAQRIFAYQPQINDASSLVPLPITVSDFLMS